MRGAVDAHTHLDDARFDADREAVWARARAAGITGAVIAAADPRDWDRVEAVATSLGLAWTLGVHPWWVPELDADARAAALQALAARPTPHGIGETGLDHHRARTPEARAAQLDLLRAHLALARERDVPVVLHCVRAYPELLRVLAQDGLPAAGGMVHAWSGPAALVDEAVARGLHVSVGAPVTRSAEVAAAAVRVPAHRLLLETDCPDQPLVRGTRGEPVHLLDVAERVAALRGEPADLVLARAADAARTLFPVLQA
ncbi:MAG: TatD family hydrolase [Alphaproteobacteria bacterium]|nr:TatD family hydrolase [Alphaproteobacteria bacterium]